MGVLDNIEGIPRRVMTLFFIVDTSGSMEGDKIQSVNQAVVESLDMLREISAGNADALIKVAALEFASGVEWMFAQPMSLEDFQWRDLVAGGLTNFGEACKELNEQLSTSHGFMKEGTGSFAPVFLLLSDGEPTDNYAHHLEKLKQNPWFKNGIKVAIAIGVDANAQMLVEFTGSKEGVLTVHNKEELKKMIRFVSVTASQIASSHSSVGKDAPASKQEEVLEKITEEVNTNEDFSGVDQGLEVTQGVDVWGNENW